MRLRSGLVFLIILALLSPSRAFEVKKGECQQILSGDARVRIHYASGLKAEVDLNNITTQIDVFPDGRRVAHKWIGGLLPLENPVGQFVYADKEAIKLRLAAGETRQIPFSYNSRKGVTTSGTLEVSVEKVEKAALGECQATFVTLVLTNNRASNAFPAARISRLFVKEIGFFIASRVEQEKEPRLVDLVATRLELIR